MLARDSLSSWSIALGLSALIHFGMAGVLSSQWTVPDFTLANPVVLPVELIETTPTPVPREEPRQPPPPVRKVLKEPPPPPPPVAETKPIPLPPPPPEIRRADPVVDTPPTPAPPAPAPIASAPPTPSPAPSPQVSAPPEKEREQGRGVGPSIGDVPKSQGGDAPAPGSPSAPAVASIPRAGTGSSNSTFGTGPSSGTSTRGITQWAHPQGGYQVHPTYPASARRLGIQGTARLKVQVLADGRVGEVLVETSAGHPDLDQAAADAVRQWRFEPARRGTEAVATWVLLPVQFQLK